MSENEFRAEKAREWFEKGSHDLPIFYSKEEATQAFEKAKEITIFIRSTVKL